MGIKAQSMVRARKWRTITTPVLTLSGAISAQPVGEIPWNAQIKKVRFICTTTITDASQTPAKVSIGYNAGSAGRSAASTTAFVNAEPLKGHQAGSAHTVPLNTDATSGHDPIALSGDIVTVTNAQGGCTAGAGFFVIYFEETAADSNDNPAWGSACTTTSTSSSTTTTTTTSSSTAAG